MARCLRLGTASKNCATSVGAQDDGELLLLLGRDHALHDPVLAEGDAVKEPQGAEGLVVIAPGGVLLLGRGRGDRRGLPAGPRRSGDLPKCLAKVATRST